MKTKFNILKIFVVFITMLILIGVVSASDDIGSDTDKISELETSNLVEETSLNDNPDDSGLSEKNDAPQSQVLSKSNDNILTNSSSTTNKTVKSGVITSQNLKTDFHSGKSMKTVITDKNTGKGISTLLKVQYLKNNKIAKQEYYYTDSDGIAYITPILPVGKYTVKISPDDDNVTAKTITKTVTIVKTTSKITAKKVTAYKGYKVTLKAVLSKTKFKDKINEGKVKFKINGKTYLVKVKNGVATKKIKLKKVRTYRYTAQYMGTKNIKKSKVSTGKAIIKQRYATKITVKNIKGNLNEEKEYTIHVTTKSGKKVASGKIKLTWNNKTLICKVNKGVVKLVVKFGGNFKEEVDGNQYYYKEFTTAYKVKYIPSSLKYKGSSTNYKLISTYKCSSCGKTGTHTHITDEKTTKIIVI